MFTYKMTAASFLILIAGLLPMKTHAESPKSKAHADETAATLGTLPEGIGIPAGETAPNAEALDHDGNTVNLYGLLNDGPIVLVFYRGGWCPYCNFQIQELRRAYPAFEKLGVTPVAVSVDKISEANKTKAAYELPFPVLSDANLNLHEAFHVTFQADDAMVEKLKGYGIDLETSSGKKHHSYAVPSIFVIGKDKKIKWAHANLDYKTRPSAKQLLQVIEKLDLETP